MRTRIALVLCLLAALVAENATTGADVPGVPLLHDQLSKEDPGALAKAARQQGDAGRGAMIFHQAQLLCTKCHTAGEGDAALGPDLAWKAKDATDLYLVESILTPSKTIKKGYETATVVTKAGKTITGIIAED